MPQTTDLNRHSIGELQRISHKLSQQIIEITTKAGSGHPSSSLSMIDILTGLYFSGVMNYDPKRPDWPERDRFILSKGHGAPGLYVTLAEAGYFDPALLSTLRETDSPIEGHPNMRVLPGVEASTGSLGQGLSIGLGHALAARVDGRHYRVYVLIGDGESDEGQIWEATMAAAKYQVDNLTLILDYNKFQQTGPVEEVMPALTPPGDKWRAFGWYTHEIDGHDMNKVVSSLEMMKSVVNQPQIIIANTKKGKGLSPFEANDTNRLHGKALSEDQAKTAIAELDAMYAKLEGA
ncbi:transketolase [Phototrophicus methaneseepsis]|uniref:Transketolase n=1 Tax=Phototrophicus methaneseepsis TaxID=2710758 RepID=A0A7S8ED09_9CHLR|nr:transketolase [Phototrophicus methaneseepsis]QPC84696.1 transketolase [Phototrophicus methaneseepsis]